MPEVNPYTPIFESTNIERTDFWVEVDLDQDGNVEQILFDGAAKGRRFACPQHVSLLVLHLRTQGPDGDVDEPARFATHPIQFKNDAGRPIAQPSYISVRRDGDFRCTVTITNTVVEEETFGFHGVFVLGDQLIGSPDPTIDLEPPPCTPPCGPPPRA